LGAERRGGDDQAEKEKGGLEPHGTVGAVEDGHFNIF
jgi:hypothetical protein